MSSTLHAVGLDSTKLQLPYDLLLDKSELFPCNEGYTTCF
jgi:hypothetical protein